MKSVLWDISSKLKTSQISRRDFLFHTKTKLIIAFLNILWDEGLILGYKTYNFNLQTLKIFLKYKNGNPVINSLRLISKPNFQIYCTVSDLWKFDSKKNLIILSTSKGLMTVNECKQAKIGGNLLCIIK